MPPPEFFPPIELWLYIIAVGGAFGVLAGLYVKVVRPVWRYLRRASTEAIIGNMARDVRSIKDDVAALRGEVSEVREIAESTASAQRSHNEFHHATSRGRPAGARPRRPQ